MSPVIDDKPYKPAHLIVGEHSFSKAEIIESGEEMTVEFLGVIEAVDDILARLVSNNRDPPRN